MKKKTPRKKLSESAYDLIRADILRCVIEPGSEVTEGSLAERYRLGKAPIRAALQRLTQEGLVRPLPRRGHLVTPITLKDIHELFELRLLLEPASAQKAATRMAPDHLVELRRLLDEDMTYDSGFNAANSRFHAMIAEASGNRRLAETIGQIQDQIERVVNLRQAADNTPTLAAEHERIIDALTRRDEDAAAAAVRIHIENVMRSILEAVHQSTALLSFEISRA